MKKLYYLFYKYFAIHLPSSNAKFSFGSIYIRRFLAKKFIKEMGDKVNIEKGAIFTEKLRIGDNSNLGINSLLTGNINIGKNVLMGPEVYIYTRNHKYRDIEIPIKNQGYESEKPVVINDNVWIGSRVTILPGVIIGKGSIIGASSVVTKNVEPYSIVGGNPAKLLKKRK